MLYLRPFLFCIDHKQCYFLNSQDSSLTSRLRQDQITLCNCFQEIVMFVLQLTDALFPCRGRRVHLLHRGGIFLPRNWIHCLRKSILKFTLYISSAPCWYISSWFSLFLSLVNFNVVDYLFFVSLS